MEWKYEKGKIQGIGENSDLQSEVTFTEVAERKININHVYVTPKLRGRGVASQTMEVVCKYLRDNNLKATATCSYAITWFKTNKDKCSDIISEELLGAPIACDITGKH